MVRRLLILCFLCLCACLLQAQTFVVAQPGYKLHVRVVDAQLRQAEAVSVEVASDTAIDLCFPEWVKHKGVRYALISARGGLLKNNHLIRSVKTGVNMQYLGSHCCYGCEQLRWASLGTGLKELGSGAFALCFQFDSLSYNAIDCHIDHRNLRAWEGCLNLSHLHLGDSVRKLCDGCFASLSAISHPICLPESLRSIGDRAFDDCSNISGTLVLPSRLEYLGKFAFAGLNSVDTLIIRSNLLLSDFSEGMQPFYHSIHPVTVIVDTSVFFLPELLFFRFYGMTKLQLPPALEIIPHTLCAYNSNLCECQLPENLRLLGPSCFYESGLRRITIPDRVVMVENYAFAYCAKMSEVVVGKSVKYMGDYCFVEDTSLRTIVMRSPEPPRIFEHTFSQMDLDCITVFVPKGAVEAYRRDPLWNRFNHIIPAQ